MGLFDKLKNVLFEEEEVEIPVITKVETKPRVEPKAQPVNRRVERSIPDYDDEEVYNEPKQEVRAQVRDDIGSFRNLKRDIELDYSYDDEENEFIEDLESLKEDQVKEEPKSPFLSFDEDEFERLNSRLKDDELPKINRREENREVRKVAKKEIEAPKRFRPSPVISPVYGILDKNYKKEDISVKSDDFNLLNEVENAIDVDSVRRKAYGTLEDEIEDTLNSTPNVKKVVEEENYSDDRSLDDMLKATIDDSIKDDIDSSIDEIKIDEVPIIEEKEDDLPTFEEILEQQNNSYDDYEEKEEVESPNDILEKTSTLKILDDIEKELDEVKVNRENKNLEDTDTDLFNLIDSMYEKEDGE